MKEYYIIGDCSRDLIWYGPYAVMRFSRPGFTRDTPALFNSFEEAYAEYDKIQKGYNRSVLAIAKMYVFKNCPPEKKENPGQGKRIYLQQSTHELRKVPVREIQNMAFCMVQLCNTDVFLN